jgi:hypothetical protein
MSEVWETFSLFHFCLTNIHDTINQHGCWNHACFSVSTIKWLLMEEFVKDQQKQSIRTNWLYVIFTRVLYILFLQCVL